MEGRGIVVLLDRGLAACLGLQFIILLLGLYLLHGGSMVQQLYGVIF